MMYWLQKIIELGLIMLMGSGCTLVHTYGTWAYERAKIADDYAAQTMKIGLCSLPEPAYLRNFRPEELEGLAKLCGRKLLLFQLEGLKKAAEECRTLNADDCLHVCEPQ